METPETPASSPEPSSPGASAGAALVPGQLLGGGRFKLEAILGQGGMGQVWRALDTRLGEENALKVLPAEIRNDPVALDDLRRETLKSRKLAHPNIIRLYDFHETPGEPAFIAMEYVEGDNLSSLRLQQPGRLFTWAFIEPLIKQLCEALDYAHSEKVVHRDLKPANMMVDGRGRLKLADFGIAATMSDSASRVSLRHTTSGTLTYMSPQQMDGELPRATDDIYALGATLYELLTSRPPFYSGDIPHQVRNLPAKPLDERLAELELTNAVPPAVAAIVMACLAKDPAQRPQSARAVAEWIGFPAAQPAGASLMDTVSEAPPAGMPTHHDAVTAEEPTPAAPSRIGLWLGMVAAIVVLVAASAWLHKQSSNSKSASKGNSASGPASSATPVADRFTSLFNGKDFAGWTVPEPNPLWTAEKGLLIGKQPGQPKRGFQLTSQKSYQNFILELETRYSLETDAAILLRKDQKLQWRIGHYRAQPEDATGSLWESGNLSPTARTHDVDKAAKPGVWNKLRLRAENGNFKVWLNDREILDFTSADFPGAGPIGLALYGKGDSQVEFRNLKITEEIDLPAPGPVMAQKAPAAAKGAASAAAEIAYTADGTYNSGAGTDNMVYALALQRDGRAVIVGNFKSFDGEPCNFVARLNTNGTLDKNFNTQDALKQEGRSAALLPDGRVLVGGAYRKSNAANYGNLVRFNSDGSADAGFNPKAAGNVHSIAVLPNGDIAIAGSFELVSGEEFSNVARLKPDGSLAAGFARNLGVDREIRCVAATPTGGLIIGGSFINVTRARRNRVAILGPDGVLDRTFLPGTLLGALAWAAAVQPDGKVLVAGKFPKAGDMKCSYLVRFTPAGKVDVMFNPGSGPNEEIYFMTLTPKGKILIGGAFTEYDGKPCGHLALLNADGGLEHGFADSGADGSVHSVALTGDGTLLLAGSFSNVGGQMHRGVARLKPVPGKAVR